MTAQVENIKTDTAYKKKLSDAEPWKLLFGGMAAGATMMAAIIALLSLILHLFGKL